METSLAPEKLAQATPIRMVAMSQTSRHGIIQMVVLYK